MYFPCLENLKKARFPEQSIELFDWWLATRRKNTLRSLNPLQFSLDCNINTEHALKLFSHSVFDEDIALLRRKFEVICPVCSHTVHRDFDYLDKKDYQCPNCGNRVSTQLLDDNTEIRFELLQAPAKNVQAHPADPIGAPRGNAPSLRASDIDRIGSDDDDVRRLFSYM